MFSSLSLLLLSFTRIVYLSFMPVSLSPLSHVCRLTWQCSPRIVLSLFISLSALLFVFRLTFTLSKPSRSLSLHSFFFPIAVTATKVMTIFCSMPKQPSECCWLLWYPVAVVIGCHYSWDLQFNPGYVIGLLSTVQAGLTPQTGVHLAMMQCY